MQDQMSSYNQNYDDNDHHNDVINKYIWGTEFKITWL